MLDCSLPEAVREGFGVGAGCAAAGGEQSSKGETCIVTVFFTSCKIKHNGLDKRKDK